MRVNANAVLRSWTLLTAFGGSYAPGKTKVHVYSSLAITYQWTSVDIGSFGDEEVGRLVRVISSTAAHHEGSQVALLW